MKQPIEILRSAKSVEWPTPDYVWRVLNDEFGFTLDVCATPDNAKCARFFSRDNDGLQQTWDGVCWMNPPYGREIKAWMRKAWQESRRGALVVCLVPARIDTAWWHEYAMKGEVRLWRRRLRNEPGGQRWPFPSAVIVFRPAGYKLLCQSCFGSGHDLFDKTIACPDCTPNATAQGRAVASTLQQIVGDS